MIKSWVSKQMGEVDSELFGAFHPDHTSTRQLAPDSLSGQRLPANLQVSIAMCNHFHLTWR